MRARLGCLALAAMLLAGCGTGIPPAQNYAVITGRAYDVATNQGVPGVAINVDVAINVTTGADGTYRVTNVPLGACKIYTITPPAGYALAGPVTDCGSVTAGQVVTIDIPLKHS